MSGWSLLLMSSIPEGASKFLFIGRNLWAPPQPNLLRKQIVHLYFVLHHVIVNIVSDSVCCYHDKMKGSLIFGKRLIGIELVLQVAGIVVVDGKGVRSVFHLADICKTIGSLHNQVNLSATTPVFATDEPRTYVGLNAGYAKGCFNLRNVLEAYALKSMPFPCVMRRRSEGIQPIMLIAEGLFPDAKVIE